MCISAEPPSFIQSLPAATKVAEGENVTLTCSVVGTPKPVVTWQIGGRPVLATYDDRFTVAAAGVFNIAVSSSDRSY